MYANVSSLFLQTQGHVTSGCFWRKTQEQGQPVSSCSPSHICFLFKKVIRSSEPRNPEDSHGLLLFLSVKGPVQLPSSGELLAGIEPARQKAKRGAMPATGYLETAKELQLF